MFSAFDFMGEPQTIDLRGFDPSLLYDVRYLFFRAWNLETILLDSTWEMPEIEEFGDMVFTNAADLVGGAGTTHSYEHTGWEYLRIDGGPQSAMPWYLTAG